MYLKIMSGEDLPDNSGDKAYQIIEAKCVEFQRGKGLGWACVDGDMIALTGNAYILNERGKTIDSFACNGEARELAPAPDLVMASNEPHGGPKIEPPPRNGRRLGGAG